VVSAYTTAANTVTLCADPGVLAIDAGDIVTLLPAKLDCGEATATIAQLADTLEDDGGTYRFTTNALEQAPSGTGASAATIADAVWDEDMTAHQTQGTAGQTLGDSAADTDTIFAKVNEIEDETDDIGAAGAGLTAADDAVITAVAAIETALPPDPADASDIAALFALVESGVDVDTIEGADPTDTIDARLLAALASQRIIIGTCDSGSTTTCVDNALTQADATQLEDRLICFDDSWCGMITTFTPGSDTATTTKIAPSTRSAKAYTIFPSTAD
jgi:hypothetical protein